MQRYFVAKAAGQYQFSKQDLHHMERVMRFKPGERVVAICDGKAQVIEIVSYRPFTYLAHEYLPEVNSLPLQLTLVMALLKGDGFTTVIQKATELGVKRIIPVITERTISRPDKSSYDNKRQRYLTIAKEAAEQSHQLQIPEILAPIKLVDVPAIISGPILVSDFDGVPLRTIVSSLNQEVALVVGPEGGFSEGESKLMASWSNTHTICLGPNVYRAETAAVVALAQLVGGIF